MATKFASIIPDGTRVVYHGSLPEFCGRVYIADACNCRDLCGGLDLEEVNGGSILSHVNPASVTKTGR